MPRIIEDRGISDANSALRRVFAGTVIELGDGESRTVDCRGARLTIITGSGANVLASRASSRSQNEHGPAYRQEGVPPETVQVLDDWGIWHLSVSGGTAEVAIT